MASTAYARYSGLGGGSGGGGSSPTSNYFNGFTLPSDNGEWSANSNGVFVDPTITPIDNALTTRISHGITVTAAAGSLPGVTFTPSSTTAVYQISATTNIQSQTTDVNIFAQLTDGTQQISTFFGRNNSSGQIALLPVPLVGLYKPGTTSPVTVKIQISGGGGSGHSVILGLNTTGLSNAIEWSIVQIVS